MKYKVGDKVKVVKIDEDNSWYEKYIGKTATITNISSERYTLDLPDKYGNYISENWLEKEVEFVGKALPIKFVVVYDENDVDPAKLFASRTELDEWLKEARDNENIVWASLRIFEVNKEMEVKTTFTLKTK
jgi:hypothetical protein